MGKCVFTGEECEYIDLADFDAVSCRQQSLSEYFIDRAVLAQLQADQSFSKRDRRLFMTEVAILRRDGLVAHFTDGVPNKEPYSGAVFRSISKVRDVPPKRRNLESEILKVLGAKKETELDQFAPLSLNFSDRQLLGLYEPNEVFHWMKHLNGSGLVEFAGEANAWFIQSSRDERMIPNFVQGVSERRGLRLTVTGWDQYNKLSIGGNSRTVFVAMAFTDNDKKTLPFTTRDAVRDALLECGFSMSIVDEVEHNDGIMDKIIGLIKAARFVIADLTYQKQGVYYEAGFAKSLGLEVIHTVNERDFKNCHFDVQHLNLIVWKDHEHLKQRLKARIKAAVI